MTLHRELTEQQRAILADDIPDVDAWWANLCRKWADPIEAEALFARKLADLAGPYRERQTKLGANYKNRAEREAEADKLAKLHHAEQEKKRAEDRAEVERGFNEKVRAIIDDMVPGMIDAAVKAALRGREGG